MKKLLFIGVLVLGGCHMFSKGPQEPGPDATPEEIQEYQEAKAKHDLAVQTEEAGVSSTSSSLAPFLPISPLLGGLLIGISRYVTGREQET